MRNEQPKEIVAKENDLRTKIDAVIIEIEG